MAEIVINGPVIASGVHNTVLRKALMHSPVARAVSSSDYHIVRVGVREGEYTSWVGTWNQAEQSLEGATPSPILDTGREGMRLKAGQAIVVKVTTVGTPAPLTGCRVNFTLGLVGGRDGQARPLVASGSMVADANSRAALAALERQINEGGLADWEEAVQIADPVSPGGAGAFHGRLQRDSATQISLQRYNGNWVEVDGELVSLGSSGLVCLSSDYLIDAGGSVTASTPGASTLYYVYVGSDGLRLSATAPSRYLGVYYLGADEAARRWRFCGWVQTNGSTQFVDDTTDRLVVNYYNRLRKTIQLRPGYTDDNASTTWTSTSTTWTAANAGTGATGSYIANGEDAVHAGMNLLAANSGAFFCYAGIGDNSSTTAAVACGMVNTTVQYTCSVYAWVPAAGYRTLVLLVRVSAGTGTYYADNSRGGGSADPATTALFATVMA